MNKDFTQRVLWSFSEYAHYAPTDKVHERGSCLADYIYSWVKSGCGARVCKRNFATVQVAALIIANYWKRVPSVTFYKPDGTVREVMSIFVNSENVVHPLLNPDLFE